jgi:hypothetical protein
MLTFVFNSDKKKKEKPKKIKGIKKGNRKTKKRR